MNDVKRNFGFDPVREGTSRRFHIACQRANEKVRGLRRGPKRKRIETELAYLIKTVKDYGFDFFPDLYVMDAIKQIEDISR